MSLKQLVEVIKENRENVLSHVMMIADKKVDVDEEMLEIMEVDEEMLEIMEVDEMMLDIIEVDKDMLEIISTNCFETEPQTKRGKIVGRCS